MQYVTIAQPLYSLLVKDATWEWNAERSLAFDRLKAALIEAPLLAHPNPSRPFILTTDASSTAVGGVLSQASTDGERPIAFESFPIPISLRNKPPYQQELYAIYHCCVTKWRCFLEGAKHPVIVRTDHKALHTRAERSPAGYTNSRLASACSAQPILSPYAGYKNSRLASAW